MAKDNSGRAKHKPISQRDSETIERHRRAQEHFRTRAQRRINKAPKS